MFPVEREEKLKTKSSPDAMEEEEVTSEIAGEGVKQGLGGVAAAAETGVTTAAAAAALTAASGAGVSAEWIVDVEVEELPRTRVEFLAPPLLLFRKEEEAEEEAAAEA